MVQDPGTWTNEPDASWVPCHVFSGFWPCGPRSQATIMDLPGAPKNAYAFIWWGPNLEGTLRDFGSQEHLQEKDIYRYYLIWFFWHLYRCFIVKEVVIISTIFSFLGFLCAQVVGHHLKRSEAKQWDFLSLSSLLYLCLFKVIMYFLPW